MSSQEEQPDAPQATDEESTDEPSTPGEATDEQAADGQAADGEDSEGGDAPGPSKKAEDPEAERIAEVGEHIDKARTQAEDAGILIDEDEAHFADSGATEVEDDQSIAPPG